MLRTTSKVFVDVSDWDNLVQETYGRPYCYQQQHGCQSRGVYHLTVPSDWSNDEEMYDSIPEVINGDKMGVKFAVWLARDPKQTIKGEERFTDLFWERNFYPDIETVANDLYAKGLVEAGDYVINIDW